jgi:hypothetical protein
MKAKINGVLYNTETGVYICQTNRGKLYRKHKSNSYFLLARDKITPLSWREAKTLAYHFAPSNLYKDCFTTMIMNQKNRTSIDLTRLDWQKLKLIAGYHNEPITHMLHQLITEEYKKIDRHLIEQ